LKFETFKPIRIVDQVKLEIRLNPYSILNRNVKVQKMAAGLAQLAAALGKTG